MLSGRLSADDRGASLIELMVGMAIALLVMTAAATFFIRTMATSSASTTDSIDTSQARAALDAWAGLLAVADSPTTAGATADRFSTITASNVVFFANVNNRSGSGARTAPTEISLSITGGRLVEQRYAPISPTAATSSYPSQPTTTRYLVGCLSSAGTCLTAGGVAATGSFTAYTACSTAASGLCALTGTSYSAVIAIGISVTLTDPHGGSPKTFATVASVPAGTS